MYSVDNFEKTSCVTRQSSTGKQSAVVADMPRLSCPDLAAAIVRWQQVWEGRDEAGACLGAMLPPCYLDSISSMQQCILTSQEAQVMSGHACGLQVQAPCASWLAGLTHGLTRASHLVSFTGGKAAAQYLGQ